jgi:hypothetical protein
MRIDSFNIPRKTTMEARHKTRKTKKSKRPTCHNKHLYRENDQHIVDLESRVAIIECQEVINRQLCTQVVVFTTEHLLPHTCPDLHLEVEDHTETEITSFATLIVLGVLDLATTSESVHTRINIFIKMQSLLSLRNTATCCHVYGIEEIRMPIMKFATDPSH